SYTIQASTGIQFLREASLVTFMCWSMDKIYATDAIYLIPRFMEYTYVSSKLSISKLRLMPTICSLTRVYEGKIGGHADGLRVRIAHKHVAWMTVQRKEQLVQHDRQS